MLLLVKGSASNNLIQILSNSFIGNNATAGGGGLEMDFTTYRKIPPTNNSVFVSNSYFIGNIALYGGGLSTYATSVRYVKHYNHFNCTNCHFERNSAQCGAAVITSRDISEGLDYVTQARFTDSKFENNSILMLFKSISSTLDGNQHGAFLISEFEVTFAGTTNFTGNNGTALYLDSTRYSTKAKFDVNSFVYFSNNSGYQGGAMVLFGKSVLSASDNCYFHFLDNTATKFGGAICALTSNRIFSSIYINSCFLQFEGKGVPKNISYDFHNNKATTGYIDIYATSVAPCNFLCSDTIDDSDTSIFDKRCYGNFTFTESKNTVNNTKHVATSAKKFTIDFESSAVMPGIVTPVKIVQYDEVGGDVSQLFPFTARVQSSNHNAAKVDPSYTAISKNSIVLLGFPKEEGKLLLESSKFTLIVRFKLTSCSPGFVFHNGTLKCTCSNNGYIKIQCGTNGLAAIASNYWAGYKHTSNATQDNLLTGLCVTQLCNPTNCNDDDQLCTLPLVADAQELEQQICGENRHGRLCRRCVQNKSVK